MKIIQGGIRVGLGFNGSAERFKKHGYAPVMISREMTQEQRRFIVSVLERSLGHRNWDIASLPRKLYS